MPLLKIKKNWQEKLEKCLVLYIGVILWINQPRISAGANCGRPGRTASSNYEPIGKAFNENDVIRYRCDKEDYVILGVSERRCQRNGTWSDEIPVCSKVAKIERIEQPPEDTDMGLTKSVDDSVCPELPQYRETMWMGYLSYSTNITAVRITVLGMDIANMDIIVQEDDGREKKCAIKRAGSEITAKSTKSVMFHCPPGTVGNTVHIKNRYQAFRICEVSVLLPPVPQCLTPDTPLHGMGYMRFLGNETIYEFRCDPGYKRWGQLRVRCQADGTWLPNSPICDEIYCTAPEDPQNGHVEYDYHRRGVPYNGTARYSCNKGYYLDGPPITTCHRWDEWDSPPPICSPNPLETTTVLNDTLDLMTESTTENNEETCRAFSIDGEGQGHWVSINGSRSLLVLICPEGFHIEGSPAVTRCLSNGSWSYSSAECKKSVESLWGSTWTPSLVLIVAVAAGAGTALFILCLSAFLVIKKRRQTRTNRAVFHLENTHYEDNLSEISIRQQSLQSATESCESFFERRSTSICTNPRKPHSALPNLPLDADPVYAQPFETATATKKLSSASVNRKEDLYNTHIYAEPVDSRASQFNIPVNVPAPRIGTDPRELVVKTNIRNGPLLSTSADAQNSVKKCIIYDSSAITSHNYGNLRTDERHQRYNGKDRPKYINEEFRVFGTS